MLEHKKGHDRDDRDEDADQREAAIAPFELTKQAFTNWLISASRRSPNPALERRVQSRRFGFINIDHGDSGLMTCGLGARPVGVDRAGLSNPRGARDGGPLGGTRHPR